MKYPALVANNFFRVIVFWGLISIHLSPIIASPTQQSESDNTSKASDSQQILPLNQSPSSSQIDQNPQTNPALPSLNCILFQDIGCKTQCVVMYNLLRLTTTGTCIADNLCSCTIQNMTLRDLWNKKFESNGLLKEIENRNLSDKVLKALQNPSRTAEESGQDLALILPSDLYENLRVKSFQNGGQPRPVISRLKDYVHEQKALPEDSTVLGSLNYEKSLYDYLEDNKNNNRVIQNVFKLIRQTENEALVEILDQFLNQHKDIFEGKFELTYKEILLKNITKELTANEVLAIIITNELINKINSVGDKKQNELVNASENHQTNDSEVD